MKIPRLLPLLATILIVAGCQTVTPVPDDGRITVNFDQPDKFTDVKSSFNGFTDKGYLDDLKSYLNRTARPYLAEGQRLTITFTDIDMAGDFVPGRPQTQDVRIMKSVYPPRLKFSWVVVDAAGATVKQGEESLTDLNYQTRLRTAGSNDSLFYEKDILKDWMRAKLGK